MNCDDYYCTERMLRLGSNDSNYIGCSKLNQEIEGFENKKITSFLKPIPDLLMEINSNNYFNLSFNEFIVSVQPSILLFGGDNKDLANQLMNYYVTELDYTILDVKYFINIRWIKS